ncbi:hypothetical protein [Microcystis aeruginosa]|jgi:hypothetical protein|uniref:hypothetical protein n=1 Tax=Microcystis aeruginosa TaxID=1126 RepID=UPI001F4FF8A0|nr:hypothetical protein [Microcystis aeruginosa]MDB9418774.1 hypothetical protein [Microcystis aeruginosa CS-556/03]
MRFSLLSQPYLSNQTREEIKANPIEQIWQYLKKGLRWKLPRDLEELRWLIGQRLEEMNKEVIASIVGRGYILDALSVVGI